MLVLSPASPPDFAAFRPDLSRFARRFVRDEDEAEDIVQFAFARFVAQDAPPAQPRAWLFRVVRNESLQRLRERIRRPIQSEKLSPTTQIADSAPAPDQAAELREIDAFLRSQIGRLNPLERKILVQFALENASIRRIAETEGLSKSHVGRTLQSIRATLRCAFAERFGSLTSARRAQCGALWLVGLKRLDASTQDLLTQQWVDDWQTLDEFYLWLENGWAWAGCASVSWSFFHSKHVACVALALVAASIGGIPQRQQPSPADPPQRASVLNGSAHTGVPLNATSVGASERSDRSSASLPTAPPSNESSAPRGEARTHPSTPALVQGRSPRVGVRSNFNGPHVAEEGRVAYHTPRLGQDEIAPPRRREEHDAPPKQDERRQPPSSKRGSPGAPSTRRPGRDSETLRFQARTAHRRVFEGDPVRVRVTGGSSRVRWELRDCRTGQIREMAAVERLPAGSYRAIARSRDRRSSVKIEVAPLPNPVEGDHRTPLLLQSRREFGLVWRETDRSKIRRKRFPAQSTGPHLVSAAASPTDGQREILALSHDRSWQRLALPDWGVPFDPAHSRWPRRTRPSVVGPFAAQGQSLALTRVGARWRAEALDRPQMTTLEKLVSHRDRILGAIQRPATGDWILAVRRGRSVTLITLRTLKLGSPHALPLSVEKRPVSRRQGRIVAVGDFDGDGRPDLASRRNSTVRLLLDFRKPSGRFKARMWHVASSP